MGKVSRFIGMLLISGFLLAATGPLSIAEADEGITSKGKYGGFVTILSPKGGDELSFNRAIIVKYKMAKGERGSHVHFYVDGENIGMTRVKKGSFDLGKLAQGQRRISMKLVNSTHAPVGVDVSIVVTIP